MVRPRFPVIALFVLLASGASRAETFTHPAAAFRFEVPAGRTVRFLRDSAGMPAYLLTDDRTSDPASIPSGVWLYAEPLPDTSEIGPDELAFHAPRFLASREPGLQAEQPNPGAPVSATFAVSGTRRGKAFRGTLFAAVRDDSIVYLLAGATGDRSDAAVEQGNLILNAFAQPVAPKVRNEAPQPRIPLRGPDVERRMMECVVLALPLGFADRAKPDSETLSGTSGTAFLINDEGYAVTNRHVVEGQVRSGVNRQSFDPLEIRWDKTMGRTPVRADVVAVSYKYDIALIKLRGPGPLAGRWPHLLAADYAKVGRTDEIAVAGFPGATAAQGIEFGAIKFNLSTVAARENDSRTRSALLLTNTRTTHGNSGGPIFDLELGGFAGALFAGREVISAGIREILYIRAEPVSHMVWDFAPVMAAHHGAPVAAAERSALALYYVAQERYGAAVVEGRRALQAEPDNSRLRAALATVMIRLGAYSEADALIAGIRNDPPSQAEVWSEFARFRLRAGDFNAVADLATKISDATPNRSEGPLLAARAAMEKADWPAAQAHLDRASELAGAPDPDIELQRALLPLRRWTHANKVSVISAAKKLDPAEAAAVRRAAQLARRLRPWRSAHARFADAMAQILTEGRADFGSVGNASLLDRAGRALEGGGALDDPAAHADPDAAVDWAWFRMMNFNDAGLAARINDMRTTPQNQLRPQWPLTPRGRLLFAKEAALVSLILRKNAGAEGAAWAKRLQEDAASTLVALKKSHDGCWWMFEYDRVVALAVGGSVPDPEIKPDPNPTPGGQISTRIHGVRVVTDQGVGAQLGAVFQVDFEIFNAKGKEITVIAKFTDAKGNILRARDRRYQNTVGEMCAWTEGTPGSDNIRYSRQELSIPYAAITDEGGEQTAHFFVNVWDNGARRWTAEKPLSGTFKYSLPPVAGIGVVQQQFEVERDNVKHAVLRVDCQIVRGQGREFELVAVLCDSAETPLKAPDEQHKNADGHFVLRQRFTPSGPRFNETIKLYLPYPLIQKSGIGREIRYKLRLFDIASGSRMNQGDNSGTWFLGGITRVPNIPKPKDPISAQFNGIRRVYTAAGVELHVDLGVTHGVGKTVEVVAEFSDLYGGKQIPSADPARKGPKGGLAARAVVRPTGIDHRAVAVLSASYAELGAGSGRKLVGAYVEVRKLPAADDDEPLDARQVQISLERRVSDPGGPDAPRPDPKGIPEPPVDPRLGNLRIGQRAVTRDGKAGIEFSVVGSGQSASNNRRSETWWGLGFTERAGGRYFSAAREEFADSQGRLLGRDLTANADPGNYSVFIPFEAFGKPGTYELECRPCLVRREQGKLRIYPALVRTVPVTVEVPEETPVKALPKPEPKPGADGVVGDFVSVRTRVDRTKGVLVITVAGTLRGGAGKECLIFAGAYDKAGQPLRTENVKFRSAGGNLVSALAITPVDDDTKFEDREIAIPLSEFRVPVVRLSLSIRCGNVWVVKTPYRCEVDLNN